MSRPIEGFPGYAVHENGLVTLVESTTGDGLIFVACYPVKPRLRNGYQRVRIRGACGRWHDRPVHRIVLEAFVGPRPTPRHHGAHFPDPNRSNNCVGNLAWKTPEENEADKRAVGTQPKGGARAPTPTGDVVTIRNLAAFGMSFTKIAQSYGMHRSSVARIVDGTRRVA